MELFAKFNDYNDIKINFYDLQNIIIYNIGKYYLPIPG